MKDINYLRPAVADILNSNTNEHDTKRVLKYVFKELGYNVDLITNDKMQEFMKVRHNFPFEPDVLNDFLYFFRDGKIPQRDASEEMMNGLMNFLKNVTMIPASHIMGKGKSCKSPEAEPEEEEEEKDNSFYLKLSNELKKHVIGQDEAIDKIVPYIQMYKAGLKEDNIPIASILSIGKTGVGKTYLSKKIGEMVFNNNIIRIDCSAYSQEHEYAKLIGSPPGYVGYEAGGVLEKLIRNPKQIIIFDEIEKASSKLHNLLLSILDEGEIASGKGEMIKFNQALIIATSNIGMTDVAKKEKYNGVGFGENENVVNVSDIVDKAIMDKFKPEFINRFDEKIMFNSLDDVAFKRIITIMLEKFIKNMAGIDIKISYTDKEVINKYLLKHGVDAKDGARPLNRAIKRHLKTPMALNLLNNENNIKDFLWDIKISMKNNEFAFDVTKIAKPKEVKKEEKPDSEKSFDWGDLMTDGGEKST